MEQGNNNHNNAARPYPLVLEGFITYHLQQQTMTDKQQVLDQLVTLSFAGIVALEHKLPCLAATMVENSWWEWLFAARFPLTYARYLHPCHKSNASTFLSQEEEQDSNDKSSTNFSVLDWKQLWFLQERWTKLKEGDYSFLPVADGVNLCGHVLGDEFGLGTIIGIQNGASQYLVQGVWSINNHNRTYAWSQWGPWTASRRFTAEPRQLSPFDVVHAPLQGKALVRFEAERGHEMALLHPSDDGCGSCHDLSCWAINYPDSHWLHLPALFLGDPTLVVPLVAATEKSAAFGSTHKNGAIAFLLRRTTHPPHDLLIFDELYAESDHATAHMMGVPNRMEEQKQSMHTWHVMRTARVQVDGQVSDMAYILDSFLLMAVMTNANANTTTALFVRPRSNPRSSYFVTQLDDPVCHMVCLNNVLAMYVGCNLHVYRIGRIHTDPFVQLSLILRVEGVPTSHRPHLFGPFVLWQQEEMEFEDPPSRFVKEDTTWPDFFGPECQQQAKATKEEADFDDDSDHPEFFKTLHFSWNVVRRKQQEAQLAQRAERERERRHRFTKLILDRDDLAHIFEDEKQKQSEKEEQQKHEEQEEQQQKKQKFPKRGSTWKLLNYESMDGEVPFSLPTQQGWRLSHIKMANFRVWVLTLFKHYQFMDIILQAPQFR